MDNLKTFLFFQVDVIADLKVGDVIYSDIKQRNNDSIITPGNWEAQKDIFFVQRMETYKDSYTITEKINLELKLIDEMQIETDDYTVIRERYRQYLMDWSIAKPTKQEEPVTLQSLFHDEKMVTPCIDILKHCEPPLIDEDCNFIGKPKGAILVWFDQLAKKGFIKPPSNRDEVPKLIATIIRDFSVHPTMYKSKDHKRAERIYLLQIETQLNEIKRSHNSQKEK
jgi:hypothetical protein